MARCWLVNSRAIAAKVRNASHSSAHQIKDCGAHRECPNCLHRIDNSDVAQEWPGLPAGVKFDPSDVELVEHLASKCGIGASKPHVFIDEFIPTLEGDQGICYTHPENLPGAKKDGNSIHFFHRTANAYATGQRKRRKIHNEPMNQERARWHKTGKTIPVLDNGVCKGWKKFMVLYKSSKKGAKPDKYNWVMHQYHLGNDEEEKNGEFVVCKIFYQQPKQTEKNEEGLFIEEQDNLALHTSPRTPKTFAPNPPRSEKSVIDDDDVTYDNTIPSSPLDTKFDVEAYHVNPPIRLEDEIEYPSWLAGESQAEETPDLPMIDDSLLCKEIFESSSQQQFTHTNCALSSNEMTGLGNNNASCSLSELANLEFDTPPDIPLADLQFGSQESILSWLDRI